MAALHHRQGKAQTPLRFPTQQNVSVCWNSESGADKCGIYMQIKARNESISFQATPLKFRQDLQTKWFECFKST